MGALFAQEQAPAPPPAPPVLENHGKPIEAPFTCTNEDIRAAGLSCTEDDPCPIFLELTAVDPVGNRVVVVGNIHSEATTLYSIVLASDDEGKTWSEPHERIRAAGFDRVQFLDLQNGWISGEELSPLPQNPFLLTTNDGGKSWVRRPIFNENVDSRFGLVQQVSFSDKTDGRLVVDRGLGSDDRYVLFDSNDGGETWQLRQESTKPIPLAHPAAASAAWRARADAPSKAFIIERHTPAGWQAIASFSVRLTPCVPPTGQ